MATNAYPALAPPIPLDPQYAAVVNRGIQAWATPPAAPVAAAPPAPMPVPQGFFTDVGHGLARGAMVTTPQMVGQALQAFGADQTGKEIEDAANARAGAPGYQVNPGGWGEAASMVVPALATAGMAFIPGVGEIAAPASAAALFGGSQYTQTREQGGSVGQALGTAAVQGVGQAVAGAVGGRLLTGATSILRKSAAQTVLDSFSTEARGSTLGAVAKNLAGAAAIQVPTQAAAAAGTAAFEQGLPNAPNPWEAAKASIAPTLMMTALMGPFALGGTMLTRNMKARVAATATTPAPEGISATDLAAHQNDRTKAIQVIAAEMGKVDPTRAKAWQLEALRAVNDNAPLPLNADFNFDAYKAQQAAEAEAAKQQSAPLALPAPNAESPVFANQSPLPMEGPGGSQTLFPFTQQAAVASAEQRNAELWRNRNAQEAVTSAGLDRPSTAIDVSELPAESIDMRAPGETIDIHAPDHGYTVEGEEPLPSTAGYTVEEGGAFPHPDQTIDIHAPLSDEPLGGVKGGRGSQPTADEVAARLEAAKQQDEPSQGMARALGLWKDSPIIVPDKNGATTYNISRQERVKWLRETLGSRASGAVNQLAGLQPYELAEAVREMWHDKGGEDARSAYVAKLGDLYQQLTGKDVRETKPVDEGGRDTFALQPLTPQDTERASDLQADVTRTAAEAAPDVSRKQGDLFKPPRTVEDIENDTRRIQTEVAGLTGEAKYEALRDNAKAIKAIVEKQQIAKSALQTIEKAQEASNEGSQIGKGAEPRATTGKASAKAAPSPVEVPQEARNANAGADAGQGTQAGARLTPQQNANAFAAPEESVGERNATPNGKEQAGVQPERQNRNGGGQAAEPSGGNSLLASPTRHAEAPQTHLLDLPSVTQARANLKAAEVAADAKTAELRDVQKTVSQWNASMRGKVVTPEHMALREAMLERVAQLKDERAALMKAHDDAQRVLQRSVDSIGEPTHDPGYYSFATHGFRPLSVHSYADAKLHAGIATADDRLFATEQGKFTPDAHTRAAAQAALDAASPELKQQYENYMQQRLSRERMLKAADEFAKERKYAAQFDELVAKPYDDEVAKAIAQYKAGNASHEATVARIQQAADRADVAQRNMDEHRRGLAGYSDPALSTRVNVDASAKSMMAHISKTHRNPLVRLVAKILAAHPALTATIHEVDNPDFNGGLYRPSTNTIEIGRGGMNPLTLMHETVHALAHHGVTDAMMNATRVSGVLTDQERRGVAALGTLRNIMQRFGDIADLDNPEHVLALKDEHEFLSEAMVNPEIQQALGGKAGLFTKFADWVRNMLGLPERQKSDFERLLQASPDLFGNPNRGSSETFRRPLFQFAAQNRAGPAGQMHSWIDAVSASSGVSAKLARVLRDGDLKGFLREHGYQWITYNHLTTSMLRRFDNAKRQFPATAAHLDDMANSMRAVRDVIATKVAVGQFLTREGITVANKLAIEAHRNRKWFDKMAEMGQEATRLGIDPKARTFEEAKARNEELTPEQFAAGKHVRDMYALLKAEGDRRIREKGKNAVTPLQLYDEVVQKHSADFTRGLAIDTRRAIHEFEMEQHPEIAKHLADLNIVTHARMDVPTQIKKMRDAVLAVHTIAEKLDKEASGRTAAIEKAIEGAKGDKEKVKSLKAQLKQEKEASRTEDVSDFAKVVAGQWGVYQKHQAVPYMHLGRSGDYFLKATVAGGDAEWARVSKVVGGKLSEGGLEAGMGPPNKGNRDLYMRFDSEYNLKRADERLRQLRDEGLFNDETGNSTYAQGRVLDKFRDDDSLSPRHIQILKNRIDANPNYTSDMKRQFKNEVSDAYIAMLPETSPLKASLFRDGDVGYSKDFMQTFGDRLTMSKVGISNAYAAPLMADVQRRIDKSLAGLNRVDAPGIVDLQAAAGAYVNEMRGRMHDLQTPVNSPMRDRMRALTASWRLMLSPAYMLMTMYQPWQMTLPFIGARYGYVGSIASMARNSGLAAAVMRIAMKDGLKQQEGADLFTKLSTLSDLQFDFQNLKKADGKTPLLTPEQLDVLNHLQWTGLLNFGQANQIARMAPEEHGPIAKFSRIASVMPHYAELTNRMSAMLSAYEMATTKGNLDHESAKKYALQIVRDTDGDHSQANVARRLGRKGFAGATTPLVVGFGQYDIQMTELLARTMMQLQGGTKESRREAARALAGVGVSTAAIAGVLGLPFMGAATGIINQVQSWMQDNNDTPPDFQRSLRNMIDGAVGPKAGEIVARGLPHLLDVDMSGRSGFQDLAPFSNFLADRRKIDDKIADGALSMMGPAVGALAGIWTGARAFYEGDAVKGMNDAFPAVVRNISKAVYLAKHGYETEGGNNQIPIMPSTWNILAQGMGLLSARKAEQSERSFAFNTNQQLLQHRQEVIRNEIYRAMDHGDYSQIGSLMQTLVDFSMKHPQYRSDIASGLKQRAQERAVAAASGTGILTNPHMYPQLQGFSFGVDQ